MDSISNFIPADIETVQQLIYQRYQEMTEIQLADFKFMLDLKPEQGVDCPMLFWHVHGANFAVIGSGRNRFRCQFFYTRHNPYGTGREKYISLEKCVITLLQLRADHQRGHSLS